MTLTWRVLGAAALLLVLLFTGPIVHKAGQRMGIYLSCPGDSAYCWEASGLAMLHGGRRPRR